MSKHIELAKKLKALADRGVDGEKQNAEAMLDALLKKHKISIEEIDGEKLQDYFFTFISTEHRLWYQIVKLVNRTIKCYGPIPAKKIKEYGLKGNYMITCTAGEYIEIEAKYTFYQKLYEEEVAVFYSAFIRANDLLLPNTSTDDKEMSYEEYLKWKRIKDLSDQIKKGEFRKQLK